MNEYDNLKKAYDRLERLYTERQTKYTRLKRKAKEIFKKNYDLEELVRAHIRLNKELTQKLKKTEIDLALMLNRQETGKKTSQTNKKG